MKARLYHGRIEVTGETEEEIEFIKHVKTTEGLNIGGVLAYTENEFYFYFKDENDEIIV